MEKVFFLQSFDPILDHGLPLRDLAITLTVHTTYCRTPLDEGSDRHRDLYLTTHKTHMTQTSKPPAGFKPAIPASKRPQTHGLHRAATRIGIICC